ncbi:hypothetical protein [Delftia sp. PS-11]|uniref:hypothetical protein n=1 Tax=Delftia sp. PS-11 TaxID=2767222 RepID=UPI002454E744|nr:hypothetical protein [Delftia sp. PS-11]
MPAHALRHAAAGGMAHPGARWLAWVLACTLVLAPLLGQMHRVVHLGGLVSTASHAQPAGKPVFHWVHALFDGHGPSDCQLLDQHHHGLAGPCAVPSLPVLKPAHALPPFPFVTRGARIDAAFFHARAPPVFITALKA